MPFTGRTLAVGALAGLVGVTGGCGTSEPAGRAVDAPPIIERSFAQGGKLTMHLSAGQYTIENSPGDAIRLEWTTRNPESAGSVQASVDVDGASAVVRAEGPRNGFTVTIGVPTRSDLWIRLSAGDLTIRGVEGHKDVSAWAGELKIGVGAAAQYRLVDTAVLAGEIQAAPFQGSKGGVFRSFMWSGTGPYELRARLTAGEITLRDK